VQVFPGVKTDSPSTELVLNRLVSVHGDVTVKSMVFIFVGLLMLHDTVPASINATTAKHKPEKVNAAATSKHQPSYPQIQYYLSFFTRSGRWDDNG
jgi:hypothetical protein